MGSNDHDDGADEQLGELLEVYDRALAAGDDLDGAPPPQTPPTLRTELEGLQACLRLLERTWDRRGRTNSAAAAVPPPTEDPLTPMPARLGRYQLRRLLGAGGFGLVYLAWDPQLRREVAVKVPRPEVLRTTAGRKRVLREARLAAGLDHPHLVPVCEAGPAVYLVSAYCPGRTLERWLNDHPAPVPTRAAAELLACLADAVRHMHARGILHRDLKPANILLQKSEIRKAAVV